MQARRIEYQRGRFWTQAVLAASTFCLLGTVAALGYEPAPDASGATHQQTKLIRPKGSHDGMRLVCFCLAKDGRIIAALKAPERVAANPAEHAASGDGVKPVEIAGSADAPAKADPQSAGELQLLDPDGKLLKEWSLDFEPQAVSGGPNETIYLAGDGVLARFDMNGKQMARAESPQVVVARKDPKQLEKRARVMLDDMRHRFQSIIQNLQSQKDELAKKDDKSLTDEDRSAQATIDRQLKMYKQLDDQQNKKITDAEVKQMMAQIAKSDRRVNAIAAGTNYVYTTTRAIKGYGFRVWRSELDFANPKQIAEGLSGCCGQMDVQCCGDEAVVAENARYRVVRYSPEGKKLASFGKSSRDGDAEGFNGCCNPMNTRAVGDELYVSESNGLVKLFSKDGKYKGIVGLAKVQPGCKSSIVDVSPDASRVYYIDVNNSAICVLERTPKVANASK